MPEIGDPRHPRSFKPKKRVPFSPPDVQRSTMPRKIIFEGQTGADHASLDFVVEVGLLRGGYVEKQLPFEVTVNRVVTQAPAKQLPDRANPSFSKSRLTLAGQFAASRSITKMNPRNA